MVVLLQLVLVEMFSHFYHSLSLSNLFSCTRCSKGQTNSFVLLYLYCMSVYPSLSLSLSLYLSISYSLPITEGATLPTLAYCFNVLFKTVATYFSPSKQVYHRLPFLCNFSLSMCLRFPASLSFLPSLYLTISYSPGDQC